MTREELYKHCKYYKGEEENPYKESPFRLFWKLERDFVDYSSTTDEFFGRWNPDCNPKYFSEIIAKVEQGNGVVFSQVRKFIIVYIIYMIEKWNPYGVDDIFEY